MKNNSEKISASEINRYCFCPYQWYYERLYGRAHLINLKKTKLEELGLTDYTKSNLNKGIKFHNTFLIKHKLKLILKFLIITTLFIFALIILLKYV